MDRYDAESVDDEDFEEMDPETRLIAESSMRRRDRAAGRLPAAFLDQDDDMEEQRMPRRRRKRDPLDIDIDLDDNQVVNLFYIGCFRPGCFTRSKRPP